MEAIVVSSPLAKQANNPTNTTTNWWSTILLCRLGRFGASSVADNIATPFYHFTMPFDKTALAITLVVLSPPGNSIFGGT